MSAHTRPEERNWNTRHARWTLEAPMEMKRAAAPSAVEKKKREEEGEEVAPERTAGDGALVATPATAVAVVEAATSAAPAAAAAAGTATDARGATGPRGRDLVNDLARWRATRAECGARAARGRARAEGKRRRAAREPGRREAPRWRAGERFVRAREGAVAVAPEEDARVTSTFSRSPSRAKGEPRGLEGSARPRGSARERKGARASARARGGRAWSRAGPTERVAAAYAVLEGPSGADSKAREAANPRDPIHQRSSDGFGRRAGQTW